jgi:8-oxo-dGTP pyrophosphatase MutT (NUDIX family)
MQAHEQPFDRAILHGHLTGSALIVSADGSQLLLGFHRKLGRWLQMGGHGEPGETDAQTVASREAEEESGIAGLALYPGVPAPVDVDVHTIPARKDVPEHLHLDIRYVLRAPANAKVNRQEEEQEELRWFSWEEAERLELDESLRRLIQKARQYALST